jgi:ATP-dependent exoDNAse (exonuclease V) beta subunit
MTRAKKALTIILHPQNKKPPETPERFSDLVRMSGLSTSGDKAWYLSAGGDASFALPQEPKDARPRIVRRPRREIAKVRPSESFFTGMKGDALFADDFGAAAQRGKEVHAEFEKVEWLDAAHTPLERELLKPAPDAVVWRERAYELFVDGKWESGQFDRVVFWREGGVRRAKICDYKTNALRNGESVEAFADRMREAYRAQMLAYRAALSALTGIAPGDMQLKLLLVSTRSVAEIMV